MLTKTLIGVAVVMALAGCASSQQPPIHHPNASHSLSAISQKSFKDGLATGKGIAIPNETDGQISANCGVTELQHMPISDIKSRWLAGCFAGTILGMVSIDKSDGG